MSIDEKVELAVGVVIAAGLVVGFICWLTYRDPCCFDDFADVDDGEEHDYTDWN